MLEWILSSAALCALVIGLRYLLRGRIGLRLQYALWGLVLLRLLLPVSFGGSRLSLMNALPGEKELLPAAPAVYAMPDAGSADPLPASAPVPASPGTLASTPRTEAQPAPAAPGTETAAEPGKAPLDTGRLLKLLWMAGSAACLLWFAGVNLRFALRLLRSRKPFSGAEDFPLPVYVTAAAETPCLFGLFRPAVYLPPEAAEDPSLDHILAHEYTHFRHGDQTWSLLRSLAVALHWFDPLAWWAAFLSRRDGELACDEGTLRRLGEEERTAYGMTLLRMTCSSRPALFRAATTMTGSRAGLKERIRLIAQKPRTAAFTLVAVILIAALALGCTFTGAKGIEYTDEWFGETAWPYADEYAKANALSLTKENYQVLRLKTQKAEVYFPVENAKEVLAVTFSRKEDGTWAALEQNPVRDIPRERGFSIEVDVPDWPSQKGNPALSYVIRLASDWNDGYLPGSSDPVDKVNRIVRVRLTGLTPMGTGRTGLTSGDELYRLEYRLLPEDQEHLDLPEGMRTEIVDGETWITEWSADGQPYLLLRWMDPDGNPELEPEREPIWVLAGETNTRELEEVYGAPEMLEKYPGSDMYAAASAELLAAYLAGDNAPQVWLNLKDFTLRPGDTYRLIASYQPSLRGAAISWFSTDPNVATVDKDGWVTAINQGTATIDVYVGSAKAQCIVRVHGEAVEPVQSRSDVLAQGQLRWVEESETAVWMPMETLFMIAGNSYPQIVEVSSALQGEPISWISEDPNVAEVNEKGVITALNPGTTKVTITVGEYSAECTVQVTKYPPDPEAGEEDGIALNWSVISLLAGAQYPLTPDLAPELTGTEVVWTSEDPEIASVNPEGLVAAVGWGTTRVYAAAGDRVTDCVVMVPGYARRGGEEDGYPVNERGETYGGIMDSNGVTLCPDLEAAVGYTPEGEQIQGYVRQFDLNNGGPVQHPRNPAEAIAYTAAMEELRREALEEGRDYLYALPLYDRDGVTVIGYFPVGNA